MLVVKKKNGGLHEGICSSFFMSFAGLMWCEDQTRAHTINKNYQAVYKGIADKFVECAGGFAQNIQRNLYPEIGEGEFYSAGADSSGYLFIVEVKKDSDDSTKVSSYSKISFGMYPDLIAMVRYVAEGKEGCPK